MSTRRLRFIAPLLAASAVFVPNTSALADTTSKIADQWDHARTERLLGVLTGNAAGQCGSCHTAEIGSVKRWAEAAMTVRTCIDKEPVPRDKIACLKISISEPPTYNPSMLGLLAAGLHTERFVSLFKEALPNGNEAANAQAIMLQQAGMPTDPALRMSEDTYREIDSWLERGLPYLDDFMHSDDPPQPCTTAVDPAFQSYLTDKKLNGWGARHHEAALALFGCSAGQSAASCLQDYPDLTATLGAAQVAQTIRHIVDMPRPTHYWVRSSPDGRYVAFGGSPSGLLDLESMRTGRGASQFEINAFYDPGFAADNQGFVFVGGRGITFCKQSLLTRLSATAKPWLSLWEPECSVAGEGTYQSVGSSLIGDRFLMVMGSYDADFGSANSSSASFPQDAAIEVSVFNSNGLTFQKAGAAFVSDPFHTEAILSPSGGAVVRRFGSNGRQSGYDVGLLDAMIEPGHTAINLRKGAQVCTEGGKASFSFDERFLVTHRYVDANGQAVFNATAVKSDIVLIDLSTGETTQLTNVPEGTFALFPHFRADNWIYFLTKKKGETVEEVAASNAAILKG